MIDFALCREIDILVPGDPEDFEIVPEGAYWLIRKRTQYDLFDGGLGQTRKARVRAERP